MKAMAFNAATDQLFKNMCEELAQVLANFQGDANLNQHIESLAEKCTEGSLTNEELAEYRGYVRGNKFIGVLQTKAVQRLNSFH